MTLSTKVLDFIATVRESHKDTEFIFTNGSCYNFYLILRQVFPEAVAYYNSEHVITKIGDEFYDITGVVLPNGYLELYKYYWREEEANRILNYKYHTYENTSFVDSRTIPGRDR